MSHDATAENLKTTKPRKALWNVSIDEYQGAVEWVRDRLHKKHDMVCKMARFDPEIGMWLFYDDIGELITKLDLDLMDRLVMILKQLDACSVWVDDGAV